MAKFTASRCSALEYYGALHLEAIPEQFDYKDFGALHLEAIPEQFDYKDFGALHLFQPQFA